MIFLPLTTSIRKVHFALKFLMLEFFEEKIVLK
jgi:hypothetical protein